MPGSAFPYCFDFDLSSSPYPAEPVSQALADVCEAQADFGEALVVIGGVPTRILYDNTKIAVAKILGGEQRQKTRAFSELQSHYLFADKFGCPAKGNDKGKVEGRIDYPSPSSGSKAMLSSQDGAASESASGST